ncbi:MAG TPA: tyrosine--tRNA ligase [Candidatus Saccharimonadales bacterium]|nr:tyrosine--tRNA ligase [Candidatus Saccharimonadales bacterium]
MTLSEELTWRGQIKDKTFDDVKWLDTPQAFYLGVDCNSAASLTIGNLAVFMLARRLRKHGWKAVLLVGGATSLIGDPGGKDEERPLKSREEIQANAAAIKKQVERLFSGMDFEPVDNYDWFKDIGYLEFLRDVGKHYSMTELVQRDYIAQRMGESGGGISYAEFSYNLIQGYDFWYLFKNKDVVLQIGGSDQWGNMLSGVPLIRKKEGKEAQALSMPLVINKSTGKKFGKSEEGAVWLDAALTSPTQFYQFWINADDEGVEDYLKVYTELSKDEIGAIVAEHRKSPQARYGQTRLAEAVTMLVHGEEQTVIAQDITDVLTGAKPVAELTDDTLKQMRQEIPAVQAAETGSVIEALVQSELASSNTEARRLLQGNAITVNGQKITRENFEASDFQNGRALLRRGKAYKDSALVELG